MELLLSSKLKLPVVFYVSDLNEISKIPIGTPYIVGKEEDKAFVIRLLEYEVLYEIGLKSGFNFDFHEILRDNGYNDLFDYWYSKPQHQWVDVSDIESITSKIKIHVDEDNLTLHDFIKDSSVYVDVNKIKDLAIFPVWMSDLDKALVKNIHNYAYNPYMYNNKHEMFIGGFEAKNQRKNVVINDISGSIPKGASAMVLTYSKHLCSRFNADLVITGTTSALIPHNEVMKLDINTAYKKYGMYNDQQGFKELVKVPRKYGTCIAFGDGHSPSQDWNGLGRISQLDGQELNKWEIEHLISFHTTSKTEIAGYAEWFKPKTIKLVTDWVKYLNEK